LFAYYLEDFGNNMGIGNNIFLPGSRKKDTCEKYDQHTQG